MTKLDPTKIGQRRNKHMSTYHQWIYSFKNRKKYQTKRIAVTKTVMIPMVTAPHLIGKHPQQEDSEVKTFAHTQSQQQHGSMIGLAYGSSSNALFFFSSSFFTDFSDFFTDFLEPEDFAYDFLSSSGFYSSPSPAAGASASPPSNRLSNSLY